MTGALLMFADSAIMTTVTVAAQHRADLHKLTTQAFTACFGFCTCTLTQFFNPSTGTKQIERKVNLDCLYLITRKHTYLLEPSFPNFGVSHIQFTKQQLIQHCLCF